MTTKISVTCENGHSCILTMEEINIQQIDVGGQINSDEKCPICNESVSAPSGRYVRDDSGLLVRVGDYEGQQIQ